MPTPYIPPQVTFTEVVSPSFQPILDRPTTVALVGEAQNFFSATETVSLVDSAPVALKQTGVDLITLVVKDALNPLLVYGTGDYVTATDSAGVTTIARRLYTTIPNNTETLAVATTTGGSGAPVVSIPVVLSGTTTSSTLVPGNGGSVTAVSLQSEGTFNTARDFTPTISSSTATVARKASGSSIVDGQRVYVSYTTTAGTRIYTGEIVTLNGTTPVNLLHQAESVDVSSVAMYNVDPDAHPELNALSASVITYGAGGSSDYIITSLPAPNFTITRSASGPTTIGTAANRGQVRVSYQATPVDFYNPTHVFSISDVESRFGSSIDAVGNINSPLSFAAMMAFANGAPDIWVVPLFHSVDGTTTGARTKPSTDSRVNYLNDWSTSVASLRDLEDVNVIVPVISHAVLKTLTDGDVLSIIQSVASHINYQDQNNQYVIGLYGEDSTNGVRAQQATLQSHGRTLGAGLLPERQVLVSPGSFSSSSSVGGVPVPIGGQYVAAALAGLLAALPIQAPLTRRSISRVADVNDFRSEQDKNTDAQAGLLVIHKRRGVVQVRHSLTTAVSDANSRELSVVRSKHFMIESLRNTLDDQLVGQLIADANAPFTVQTTVQGVLENLLTLGAIAGYAGIAARLLPNLPTVVEVRFSYLPAYPLNYINVVFSLDLTAAGGGGF
jgi:hypothetical protein